MQRLGPVGTRKQVEMAWVLDADQLPRPIRPGDGGVLGVASREGLNPTRPGYVIRNIGVLELDAWLPETPASSLMRFRLEFVPLWFGGMRTYLACPRCGRRSLKLYMPFAVRTGFACRGCHGLAYRSSSRRPRSVAEWRAYVERPLPSLPSPESEWRRDERRKATAAPNTSG